MKSPNSIIDLSIGSITLLLLLILNYVQFGEAQIITQSVSRISTYATNYGSHDGVGSSLLSFMQLVRQRSTGNQLQQCPCVHLPGSDKCIAYDSRYLAVSVEEAILTFVDQTMDPRFYTGPITPGSFTCSSFECRQCVAMISARLRQIGLLRRQLTFSFPVPTPDQINPSACPRIRLSRGINIQAPPQLVNWVTEGIAAGTALRDEFSRRPRSLFAIAVEQAIREARAAGSSGRSQISNLIQSAGTNLANLAATSSNQNNNGQSVTAGGTSRNQNNNGQSVTAGGTSRNQNNNNVGIGSNGRVIGESRPRIFPPRQPQRLQQNTQVPRFQQNTPRFQQNTPRFQQNTRQQFTPNPGQINRFQQTVGNQFNNQQPQFNNQQPQFNNQQPQFNNQFGNQGQQQIINQPQQFQQNWNNQQPQWNGQSQQGGFGIQPQAVTNMLGQASQFIPNPFGASSSGAGNQFGSGQFGSGQFGGNANGGSNGGLGIGLGAGGSPNWGGIGGGGAGGGNSEHESSGLGLGIGFKRTKRQSAANIVGERFIINCIEKGDAETESGDFLNLCTVCWTWRQLPENYFPRLLNELVCQEDEYCLSGWGTCKQRHRNVDILQKRGNDWIPTTISTAACCDCKVKAGSDAHSLVIGGRK